jgi:hypothetical protein
MAGAVTEMRPRGQRALTDDQVEVPRGRRVPPMADLSQMALDAREAIMHGEFTVGDVCVVLLSAHRLTPRQAGSELGYSAARVERMALMASLYPDEHRHPHVPIEIYKWLASRENAEQLAEERWCCKAADNNWSLRDLRKEIGWAPKAPDLDEDAAMFERDAERLSERWATIAVFRAQVVRLAQRRLGDEPPA